MKARSRQSCEAGNEVKVYGENELERLRPYYKSLRTGLDPLGAGRLIQGTKGAAEMP